MEVTGKVHKIGNSETFGNYEKREIVIKTDEQYPQTIAVEFGQGKCNDFIDKLVIGQDVTIGINLGGREWVNPQGQTKYFNSIKGWKITAVKDIEVKDATTPSGGFLPGEKDDDLPY